MELTVQERGAVLNVLANEKMPWSWFKVVQDLSSRLGLNENEMALAGFKENGSSFENNFAAEIEISAKEHEMIAGLLKKLQDRLDREGATAADWASLASTFDKFDVGGQ